jgi:hypothetical protein
MPRAHTPITSVLVALQLGLVAPVAITAALSQFKDNPGNGRAGVNQAPGNVAWFDGGVFIARANATGFVPWADPKPPTEPTPFECIVKAVVLKPC